jgi:hypothetical protein
VVIRHCNYWPSRAPQAAVATVHGDGRMLDAPNWPGACSCQIHAPRLGLPLMGASLLRRRILPSRRIIVRRRPARTLLLRSSQVPVTPCTLAYKRPPLAPASPSPSARAAHAQPLTAGGGKGVSLAGLSSIPPHLAAPPSTSLEEALESLLARSVGSTPRISEAAGSVAGAQRARPGPA